MLPASRFGRRELVEHVKDPESNDRVGYFGSDPGDPVIAPAGSIVVFGSTVFHRSGANPSGQARRAYLAQYAPTPIQNKPGEWPQYFAEPFLRDGRRVPQARRLLAKRASAVWMRMLRARPHCGYVLRVTGPRSADNFASQSPVPLRSSG